MFSSRRTRARRARIAVALLGTAASLALPSIATAGGISAVPESVGVYEADHPYNTGGLTVGQISIYATVTCRPTNILVTWCQYSHRHYDGTAREKAPTNNYGQVYDDYDFGPDNFRTASAAVGETKRVNIGRIDPIDDAVVEGHETLTYEVVSEGMTAGQVRAMGETEIVSARAQITIWNDDLRPGQSTTPWTAPKKTTCWTCR
jgi:hypothetical protein